MRLPLAGVFTSTQRRSTMERKQMAQSWLPRTSGAHEQMAWRWLDGSNDYYSNNNSNGIGSSDRSCNSYRWCACAEQAPRPIQERGGD